VSKYLLSFSLISFLMFIVCLFNFVVNITQQR
jgi:hypothetical protein